MQLLTFQYLQYDYTQQSLVQGLSPQAASALQMAVDIMGTGGVGYAVGARATSAAQVIPRTAIQNSVPRKVPTWYGSGPEKGIIGLNAQSKSNKALLNFYPRGGVEYIYDPTTKTFLVRGSDAQPMHEYLANSINADKSRVVGGILQRDRNGNFYTNEASGHYWQNWTPAVRQDFVNTMKSYGITIKHSEGQ